MLKASIFAGGLVALGVIGFSGPLRSIMAQDDIKKSVADEQDEIRKALDSLKKGPAPKEEKPADLNPLDRLGQAEEALKKAKKALQENPNSDEAKQAVADAQKKFEEANKAKPNLPNIPNFPNFQQFPNGPVNPADLEKEMQRMMEELQKQMQLMPLQQFPGNRIIIGGRGGLRARMGDGRLGVRVESPNQVLIDQLDLPANVGQVIMDVVPNLAADRAGIKVSDILLEVGGKAVPSEPNELIRFMREFKADEKVDVVVMRKGKKETIKGVTLPEAKPEANRFQIPQFQINPRLQNGFAPQFFGGGGKNVSTSVSDVNGEVTIKHVEDNVTYVIVGAKDDGGLQPTSITIMDNGKEIKAKSVKELDEPYKPTVENLLKTVR